MRPAVVGLEAAMRPREVVMDSPTSLSALAGEARRGDGGAADRLWDGVRPRLLRIGLALGVPAADVPDLVQDVLLAAHRGLRTFDPEKGSLEAWLGTILVHRARNLFRSGRRRRGFFARFPMLPARQATRGAIDAVEARLTLERLLTFLTEKQREVVALYEIGELSAEETGRLLDITAAGVRSIARDARIRLSEAAAGQRLSQEERR